MFGEHAPEYLMLAGYLVILLWIGIRSARQVKSSADYALAGRSVPWIVILATTAATMIGGGASVGMVSKVASAGIAWAVVTCAWHIQLIFTGLFVAPKLQGLQLTTVGDFFQVKYGPLARELAVVNCTVFLVGALAAQMAAIGHVTNAVLGIPYTWALLIGAAVTIFYSTVGGIRAVVTTDVVQFVILVIGIAVASALLLARSGGFEAMADQAQPNQFSLGNEHLSGVRLISLLFAYLMGELLIPPYTQRCFIARDSAAARWGVAGAGLFLLLFLPVATAVLGTSAQINPDVRTALAEKQARLKQADPSLSDEGAARRAQQVAFPTLVRATFHPLFAGVMIAAIIAAVMSSADSCLSCLSTVAMEDVYRRHWRPEATDRQLLGIAKATTLLSGLLAMACAWAFRDIASILEFVYDFWAPVMVLPFLVALFWYDRRRVYAASFSMLAGMAGTIAWMFVPEKYDLGPALIGFAVALVTFLVALPLTSGWRIAKGGLFDPQPVKALEAAAGSSARESEQADDD